MRAVLTHLRIVRMVFWFHLKQMIVDSFTLFTVIVQPLIIATLAIFMLRQASDFRPIYALIGSLLGGLWSGTLYCNGDTIQYERWCGTLETIIASPTHLATIIIAKSFANVFLSLSSILVSYPLAILLFGYTLTITHPLTFAVSLLLSVLALTSLGMIFAPIMSIRPGSGIWLNILEFPVYLLSGFLFSISLLPPWTTPLSYALAPYWAAYTLHATSSGDEPGGMIVLGWGVLVASCVVYWIISLVLFKILLRKARREATLALQ